MFENKTCRGHALRMAVGTMALVLLLAGGAIAATPISSCTIISSPGTYTLTQSIMNSPASTCINITSSNVVFDGAGYTIDGVDTSGSLGVYVFNSYTTITNVTVKNLIVTDWWTGIEYYSFSQNGSIINNTVSSNKFGISLLSSSNNTIINNFASSNQYGISLLMSNNNYISNNFFNNTDNSYISYPSFFTNPSNKWNSTKTAGTNIIGGSYLGGNVWAYPNGTGFSQTCTDANGDGICESSYVIDAYNIDYLPLHFITQVPLPPINITSWGNNYTNDQSLNFNVVQGETVIFNITTNNNIDSWNSLTSDPIYFLGNTSTTLRIMDVFNTQFNPLGTRFINISVTNSSTGTSDYRNWTVNVLPATAIPIMNITSWSNNVTNNQSLNITVPVGKSVYFNVTTNINIDITQNICWNETEVNEAYYGTNSNFTCLFNNINQSPYPHAVQMIVRNFTTNSYDYKTWHINVVPIPPPTIVVIAPNTGTVGSIFTIGGTGFNNSCVVTVGGVTAVSSVISDKIIQVFVPSLSTGTYDVTVTNPDGQSATVSNGFTVTGAPALVASIAPSSRVAQVGSSITLLVAVQNYGTDYAQDVQLTQHTTLPVIINFKTWDGLTKFGVPNAKVTIKPSGVVFFVLDITPTSPFPASSMTFDIKTTNGTIVSAPISLVNTFTLAATSSPSADIVMISTTTDVSASVNVPGAFAIATSNVGNAAAANVSLVVDAGTMPLVVSGKQTNPTTGAIIGDAQNINIGVGEQPTFAVFYTPTGSIANDPANNRIKIKLVDGSGNILGSQSVAIHT